MVKVRLYYSKLSFEKINITLPEFDEVQKSIELKPFPRDDDEKNEIFLNFFNNYVKQRSFSGDQMIEDIKSHANITNIIFSTISSCGRKRYVHIFF